MSNRCCCPPPSASQFLSAIQSSIISLSNRVTSLEEQMLDLALTEYGHVVYNEPQLDAALAARGMIFVAAPITLTHSIIIPDNTFLHALSLDGQMITLTYPHVAGVNKALIIIQGRRAGIKGFRITANRPLAADLSTIEWGIEISGSPSIDVSDFYIGYCEIFGVNAGIVRNGIPVSLFAERGLIEYCYVHSFCGELNAPAGRGGVTLSYNTRHLRLSNIHIAGRVGSETHIVRGNGFWVGNYSDHTIYENCYVTEVDRHGYEHWNSQDLPSNFNGNKNPQFIGCEVGYIGRDFTWTGAVGAFGFSVLCSGVCKLIGCHIDRAAGIGYEMACDSVNDGSFVMEGCSWDLVEATGGMPSGISLNSLRSPTGITAVIKGNVFGRCQAIDVGPESAGIAIFYGSRSVHISGNTFTDSGNRQIYAIGNPAVDPYNGLVITDNTFNWSATPPPASYQVSISLLYIKARAVVKNNVAFIEAGSGLGTYRLTQTGSVLTGGPSSPALVGGAADVDIAGDSNLVVERSP